MTAETAVWRRLDKPGHDACRLTKIGDGWDLSGTAIFASRSIPTCLHYTIICDERWQTLEGRVSGWSGPHAVTTLFTRTASGSWAINDRASGSLADCVDLDFGFTPATNLLQIKRLALRIGERADVPVAWFDIGGGLHRLPQTYERLSSDRYRYEAPSVGYVAELEVNATGFVRTYPRLWQQIY
jgi:hypothetical protein